MNQMEGHCECNTSDLKLFYWNGDSTRESADGGVSGSCDDER